MDPAKGLTCAACSNTIQRAADVYRVRPSLRFIVPAIIVIALGGATCAMGALVDVWIHDRPLGTGAWVPAAAAIIIFAIVLASFGLYGDRSRGRRRCPKCWYSLHAGASTCPECGTSIGSEREAYRPRRRWGMVLTAGALLLIGAGALVTWRVNRRGWVSLMPNVVLIEYFEHLPDSFIDVIQGENGRHDTLLARMYSQDQFSASERARLKQRAIDVGSRATDIRTCQRTNYLLVYLKADAQAHRVVAQRAAELLSRELLSGDPVRQALAGEAIAAMLQQSYSYAGGPELDVDVEALTTLTSDERATVRNGAITLIAYASPEQIASVLDVVAANLDGSDARSRNILHFLAVQALPASEAARQLLIEATQHTDTRIAARAVNFLGFPQAVGQSGIREHLHDLLLNGPVELGPSVCRALDKHVTDPLERRELLARAVRESLRGPGNLAGEWINIIGFYGDVIDNPSDATDNPWKLLAEAHRNGVPPETLAKSVGEMFAAWGRHPHADPAGAVLYLRQTGVHDALQAIPEGRSITQRLEALALQPATHPSTQPVPQPDLQPDLQPDR
ncbi:MAG: zinc ribbon domain-containing protein [Planctomycetota bacterium]|nr:zinc ribbon domain-containing protein [Planctomycetota bacterium]